MKTRSQTSKEEENCKLVINSSKKKAMQKKGNSSNNTKKISHLKSKTSKTHSKEENKHKQKKVKLNDKNQNKKEIKEKKEKDENSQNFKKTLEENPKELCSDNDKESLLNSMNSSMNMPVKSTNEIIMIKSATEYLSKQMKNIAKSNLVADGVRVEPNENDIFKWNIYLSKFEDTQLGQDLEKYKRITGKGEVKLEVLFPFDFPSSPPFVRVIYPKFLQWTGHVTIGGSVCVYELTSSGWNSQNEISSFFIMLRNLLLEGKAAINLLETSEYSLFEAKSAYNRVALQHGWKP